MILVNFQSIGKLLNTSFMLQDSLLANKKPKQANLPSGRVVGIIKRKWRQYCGMLQKSAVKTVCSYNTICYADVSITLCPFPRWIHIFPRRFKIKGQENKGNGIRLRINYIMYCDTFARKLKQEDTVWFSYRPLKDKYYVSYHTCTPSYFQQFTLVF